MKVSPTILPVVFNSPTADAETPPAISLGDLFGTNHAPPPRPRQGMIDEALTSFFSLRGNSLTEKDLSQARKAISGAEQRLTAGKVQIRPVGGGQARTLIRKQDLSPQAISALGYSDGGMAIPELGQVNGKTWRKPNTFEHLHRHPQWWTMHRDLHPSMGQVARGEAPKGSGSGVSHVAKEGLPGMVAYIRAATGGGKTFTEGHKNLSLMRSLGINGPRTRQEFLTDVNDYGVDAVNEARRNTIQRIGVGVGAAGALGLAALIARRYAKARRKKEQEVAATPGFTSVGAPANAE